MRTVWLAALGAFVIATGLFVSAGLSSDIAPLRLDTADQERSAEDAASARLDSATASQQARPTRRFLTDRAPDAPDPIQNAPAPTLVLPPRDLPKLRVPGAVTQPVVGAADPETQARAMVDRMVKIVEAMVVRVEEAGGDPTVVQAESEGLRRLIKSLRAEGDRLLKSLTPKQKAAVETYARARIAPLMARMMAGMASNHNP